MTTLATGPEATTTPSPCRACGRPRRRRTGQPGVKGANGYCEACNNRWHVAGCPPEGPPPPMSHAERAALSNADRAAERAREREEVRGSALATADWPSRAACAGMDTELFFPSGPGVPADPEAKAACATCPVRSECLGFALDHPRRASHGIWGGMTEDERTAERRRRARRRVA